MADDLKFKVFFYRIDNQAHPVYRIVFQPESNDPGLALTIVGPIQNYKAFLEKMKDFGGQFQSLVEERLLDER